MRPLVRDAMHTSAAVARKVKKDEEAAREAVKALKSKAKANADARPRRKSTTPSRESAADDTSTSPPRAQRSDAGHAPKEFASFSTSAPRSVNDVVQAPPGLSKLPRGAKRSQGAQPAAKGSSSLREGVLSMAQKVIMEEERERAIKAYRELKKRQAAVG